MGIKVSKDLERKLLAEGVVGPKANFGEEMPQEPHTPRGRGRTVRHEVGRMNNLEEAFAGHLGLKKAVGDIFSWKFEAVKLRLADKTFYTPDFMVVAADGWICFYEVKGFWEDDARVKIKVAAETFPEFAFYAVKGKKVKGAWQWDQEAFR